jgi:transcriptional regulator GlxA family with amidase domain
MSPAGPVKVAIAAYEGVSLLDLAGPLEALRITSTATDHSASGRKYDCTVVSVRGGTVMTADGVGIVTEQLTTLDESEIDTIIVAGACSIDDVGRDRELIEWLRRRAPGTRRVCSVCIGAFLLAEAGLLDGRRAVTHWMHCDLLSSRYPRIAVEPDAIYVQDGPIWTSAGVTAGDRSGAGVNRTGLRARRRDARCARAGRLPSPLGWTVAVQRASGRSNRFRQRRLRRAGTMDRREPDR